MGTQKCYSNILPCIFYVKTKFNTRFFYKQHFYKQRQAEIGKKYIAKAKQHHKAELLLFENFHFLHPRYHPRIIGYTLKNERKTSTYV